MYRTQLADMEMRSGGKKIAADTDRKRSTKQAEGTRRGVNGVCNCKIVCFEIPTKKQQIPMKLRLVKPRNVFAIAWATFESANRKRNPPPHPGHSIDCYASADFARQFY